ncbi:MAG: retropepsin-like aspartic protease [Novosphingobium sp.]
MNAALASLVLALSVPQVAAQSTAPTSDTDVLSTDRDGHDRLTVGVRLGESAMFRFMIDTGSQNTVVSDAVVKQLALVPHDRATVIGVAGAVSVDMVEIDEIGLGRRTAYGIIAPVLQRADIGADGILGLDSLQDQRVLLDFRRKVMLVGDARSLGGNSGFEIVVTARRRSGQLILTDAVIDGVHVDVVVDTGSDTTLGNRALQRELGRRGRTSTQTQLTSVTGQQLTADIGYADQFRIHGLTINGVMLAFADSPTFGRLGLEQRPAVFLGMREMRVFPRIAIDFKTRKVLFDLPDSGDPAYFGTGPDPATKHTPQ